MKKLLLNLGLFAWLFIGVTMSAKAEEKIDGNLYNGGYNIVIEEGSVVEVLENGETKFTADYEDGERISKHGQDTCQFTYTDGMLVSEIRNGKRIEYFSEYDESNKMYKYVGFKIDDQIFFYIWDDEYRITGIADESGTEIVKYVYSELQVIDVMEYNGQQWVSNEAETFLGNYNKIRSYGAYLDDETGWYCSNGVYDDVKENKVVGMKENDIYLSDINPFSVISEDGIMPLGYEDDDLTAELWADELLESASFNAAKASGYYSNSTTSTVEIVARAIYGENNVRTLDQSAIAWIILNRYHYRSSQFGSTIRSITANASQFNGVNSAQGRKKQSSTDACWRNAVYLACLILTNDSEACWNVISAKPNGITNQIYFRSANTLGSTSQIYEKQGKLYAHYSSGDVAITNACIAGKGTATTVSGLKNLCTEGINNYNVYFYHDN